MTLQEPLSLGEFAGHEIYPMPMFATLAVADPAAVCAWYETALGFAVVFRAPDQSGQPPLVHLRRPIFTARNPNPDPEQMKRMEAMFGRG